MPTKNQRDPAADRSRKSLDELLKNLPRDPRGSAFDPSEMPGGRAPEPMNGPGIDRRPKGGIDRRQCQTSIDGSG